MICPFIIATSYHTQSVSYAIIKLFSLFNTTAKTNDIDSTRPTPLSIYERTHYWLLEFLCDLEFVYKYFVIQNIEILGINRSASFIKKRNK